jgi:methyltransferase, FkbM family
MIIKTIRFILHQPLVKKNKWQGLKRYFLWQIGYRLNPYPIIYPFVEDSKLIVEKGMAGATGNIYAGLHDFEEMGFTLHLLRPGDLFTDIGANIGSYTILASAVAGADALAFEPVPSTFKHLLDNIHINNLGSKVLAWNIGLDEKKNIIKFSSTLDTVNHALAPSETNTEYIEVPVDTLDEYCSEKVPLLMKLDVEGFEYQVLKGAAKTLSNPSLKAIIIELNGSGGRYGIADDTINELLKKTGFLPYMYDPFKRILILRTSYKCNSNTIYVRDIEFVTNRIKNQRKIKVLSHFF